MEALAWVDFSANLQQLSLGLRCGSGKSSLVNCSIARQLEDMPWCIISQMTRCKHCLSTSSCQVVVSLCCNRACLDVRNRTWAICTWHDDNCTQQYHLLFESRLSTPISSDGEDRGACRQRSPVVRSCGFCHDRLHYEAEDWPSAIWGQHHAMCW